MKVMKVGKNYFASVMDYNVYKAIQSYDGNC